MCRQACLFMRFLAMPEIGFARLSHAMRTVIFAPLSPARAFFSKAPAVGK
jgi:hypothetical protein